MRPQNCSTRTQYLWTKHRTSPRVSGSPAIEPQAHPGLLKDLRRRIIDLELAPGSLGKPDMRVERRQLEWISDGRDGLATLLNAIFKPVSQGSGHL